MKISKILCILLCMASIGAYGDKEIDKLTLPIMDSIHKGEVSNIFSMAFPEGSPGRRYFSDEEMADYDSLFENSFKALGKSSGYFEYFHSDIPDVLVLKYYVVKFEVEPAIVKLVLYKQDKEWRINGVEVDDKLDSYLEESAKYRLGELGLPDVR